MINPSCSTVTGNSYIVSTRKSVPEILNQPTFQYPTAHPDECGQTLEVHGEHAIDKPLLHPNTICSEAFGLPHGAEMVLVKKSRLPQRASRLFRMRTTPKVSFNRYRQFNDRRRCFNLDSKSISRPASETESSSSEDSSNLIGTVLTNDDKGATSCFLYRSWDAEDGFSCESYDSSVEPLLQKSGREETSSDCSCLKIRRKTSRFQDSARHRKRFRWSLKQKGNNFETAPLQNPYMGFDNAGNVKPPESIPRWPGRETEAACMPGKIDGLHSQKVEAPLEKEIETRANSSLDDGIEMVHVDSEHARSQMLQNLYLHEELDNLVSQVVLPLDSMRPPIDEQLSTLHEVDEEETGTKSTLTNESPTKTQKLAEYLKRDGDTHFDYGNLSEQKSVDQGSVDEDENIDIMQPFQAKVEGNKQTKLDDKVQSVKPKKELRSALRKPKYSGNGSSPPVQEETRVTEVKRTFAYQSSKVLNAPLNDNNASVRIRMENTKGVERLQEIICDAVSTDLSDLTEEKAPLGGLPELIKPWKRPNLDFLNPGQQEGGTNLWKGLKSAWQCFDSTNAGQMPQSVDNRQALR